MARAALSNSSYFMYKNTNSGHKCAFSAARMTLGMLMRATNNFKCSITARTIRPRNEGRKSILTFGRLVLAQEDGKLGEDTHVGALETKTGFEQRDDFLKVTSALVNLDEGRKLLGVNDDVQTADLGQSEVVLLDTSRMNLLPDSRITVRSE